MKLIVKELEKLTSIEETLNLNSFLNESVDLIELKDVLVRGKILKSFEEVKLNLAVNLTVIQKCARTLLPVTYPLEFETEIIYSKDDKTYDYYLSDTIDLDQIIFAEILLEKEPFVYHESAKDYIDESEGSGHPAFQALKIDTK
ncbi:hypothetical protein JV173_02090 [Acholeplasma equirhinis]|uniref:YceD family protein n=1 Tax=Acholeplasma equirhinis TaxID=555393 RepID=UPI00197A9D30|nr:hypothetical protein [Acholeplasma equirhinis]MBN3490296.1 hypothetical protein [Acholeplasma equirhinis]